MKSIKNRMAFLYVASFLYFGLFGAAERLSFDRLYPKNYFTQAREDCMQVWAAFEELCATPTPSIRSALLIDAVVGKLAFAKSCLKKFHAKKIAVCDDDLIELSRIIGTIEQKAQDVSRSVLGQKGSLIKRMLEKMRAKMQQAMNLG